MANVQEIQGKILKLEPNKWGFYQIAMKDNNDKWINIGLKMKQPPRTIAKGDTVKLSYDAADYNNIVGVPEKLPDAPQGGGYKGGKGGYSGGGKKPFVDNSVGMGIGAALNNAVQLLISGKIKETEVPSVLANLYTLSEAMKQAATAGTLEDSANEYQFSLSTEKKAPAKKPAAKKAAKKEPEPEPEEEGDDDGEQDFDDDIPF